MCWAPCGFSWHGSSRAVPRGPQVAQGQALRARAQLEQDPPARNAGQGSLWPPHMAAMWAEGGQVAERTGLWLLCLGDRFFQAAPTRALIIGTSGALIILVSRQGVLLLPLVRYHIPSFPREGACQQYP